MSTVIDVPRVTKRLDVIRDNVSALRDMQDLTADQLGGNRRDLAAAKHFLREGAVVTPDRASTYAKMVKYRNRLVHFYADVTVEEIWALIQDELSDFERFIGDVASYVAGLEPEQLTGQ